MKVEKEVILTTKEVVRVEKVETPVYKLELNQKEVDFLTNLLGRLSPAKFIGGERGEKYTLAYSLWYDLQHHRENMEQVLVP